MSIFDNFRHGRRTNAKIDGDRIITCAGIVPANDIWVSSLDILKVIIWTVFSDMPKKRLSSSGESEPKVGTSR